MLIAVYSGRMNRGIAALIGFLTLVGLSVQGLAGAPAPAASASHLNTTLWSASSQMSRSLPWRYQARRRLEASSSKLNESAWMEAVTAVRSEGGGFSYSIVAQGGSERIQRRVLRSVLEAEREHSAGRMAQSDAFP